MRWTLNTEMTITVTIASRSPTHQDADPPSLTKCNKGEDQGSDTVQSFSMNCSIFSFYCFLILWINSFFGWFLRTYTPLGTRRQWSIQSVILSHDFVSCLPPLTSLSLWYHTKAHLAVVCFLLMVMTVVADLLMLLLISSFPILLSKTPPSVSLKRPFSFSSSPSCHKTLFIKTVSLSFVKLPLLSSLFV